MKKKFDKQPFLGTNICTSVVDEGKIEIYRSVPIYFVNRYIDWFRNIK